MLTLQLVGEEDGLFDPGAGVMRTSYRQTLKKQRVTGCLFQGHGWGEGGLCWG